MKTRQIRGIEYTFVEKEEHDLDIEIEERMIMEHGRKYVYDWSVLHAGNILYAFNIKYRKGSFIIARYFTPNELRDRKLKEIGI